MLLLSLWKLKIHDLLIVVNFYKTEVDVIITKADFQLAFPDSKLPNKAKMVTTSQHYKVTIILEVHAILTPFNPPIKIRILKHSY